MRIGFVFNRKPDGAAERDSNFIEFDTEETLSALSDAIKSNGHSVIEINTDEDAYIHLKNKRNDTFGK